MTTIRILALACTAMLGCATGKTPERDIDDSSQDGDVDASTSGIDAGGQSDAPVPGGTAVLRATDSDEVTQGNSVACLETNGTVHFTNHYYRVFELDSFGISTPFNVETIEFGVEVATAGQGNSQAATLNLYELVGDVATGVRTRLSANQLSIPNMSLGLFQADVSATVSPSSSLLVELMTPDGRPAGNSLVAGSNQSDEISPTFLEAPDCSVSAPTPAASAPIDRPEMRWVVNVTGSNAI